MTALPNTIRLSNGKIIPVILPDKAVESEESKILRKAALTAGKEAVSEAFRNGFPITIGKDGKIINLYPDGHEEIIGELPQ